MTKDKSEYSLARWQIDAHASWKSSGNSLLSYEDMKGAGIDKIRHLFRNYEHEHIYNYEEHVAFAEELEAYGKLPKTFMAVDPVSKKPWIWDDVTRMRTLNTKQSQKKRQNHICPLQLDIVERLIERYSNKGDWYLTRSEVSALYLIVPLDWDVKGFLPNSITIIGRTAFHTSMKLKWK
nr:hypothetical protein [Bacteroides helcogenes]